MRNNKSTSTSDGGLDLDLLLARFPLEPWLERRGFAPQGRQRKEWIADCPWCGAEEKLSVNAPKRFWRCFVCAKKFGLLDLLAEWEGGYAAAVEVVRAASGGRSLAMIPEDWNRVALSSLRAPQWEPLPVDPPEHFEFLRSHHPYTLRRGLDLDNMLRLGVGVCSWGYYQDRLVFPVRRYDGRWVYYQTRATWERDEQPPGTGKYRKNLNPIAPDPQLYASAADVLLGLECVRIGGYTRIALVEGPTDWCQAGPDAVAALGKVLSERHVELLVRAGVKEIDVCLDPDAWDPPTQKINGRDVPMDRPPPARAVCDRLAPHFVVRVVRYGVGTDPGSHTVAENRALRERADLWGTGSRLAFVP